MTPREESFAQTHLCKACGKPISPGDENTAPRNADIRAHSECVKGR